VEAFTEPGDLVVDLFCQGPAVVREAAAAGRRVLGLSVNPLLLVAARLGLDRRDDSGINAAFTRLTDAPKGDVPLSHHLAALYDSACPVCGEPGTAEWFAWDRDGEYPFQKAVRCGACESVQEGPPDDRDVELARRTSPRGLAYYYALDRVAPPGHPARERATELVELYTPRNLSALIDLAMRLDGLEVDREISIPLTAVLLNCLDRCAGLDSFGEERARPRTLRLPTSYLERNVWLCFTEGLADLLSQDSPAPVHRAADVKALVQGEEAGYVLVSQAARELRQMIEPGSAALIVADPPRPDAVLWALSALWAGWLWESPAAVRMRPFLRRRRFDWDWHWRVLEASLRASGPLLADDGHLLTLFSDPDDTLLESVCLAAAGAGFRLAGWGHSPDVGHRLLWRWEGDGYQPAPDVVALERELADAAGETLMSTLRARGEPSSWAVLHAGTYAGLAERQLLAQAAAIPEDGPAALGFLSSAVGQAARDAPIAQAAGEAAEGGAWWLADPGRAPESLADQVETQVWEVLIQQSYWVREALVNAVYARLPGPLTPELALVLVCIDSYSTPAGDRLRLRVEDDPVRRSGEIKQVRGDLVALGERLGFRIKRRGGWDVRWLEAGREIYAFVVSSTAVLAERLLEGPAVDDGAQRCLVLPGGRAHLVTFKLQRDTRLDETVKKDRWQFIKFRHLRRLVAKEELDRHALKTVLGLDPIAEQEAAQIPLL